MHIAFAASECVPFSKTGGLADVIGALPPALPYLGHKLTAYVPRYRSTKLENPRKVIASITIPFDDRYRFCSVLDGGVRRGTDVVKALALGASAVGIGRPFLWGLGAFGQAGVDRVIDIMQGELKLVMGNCGTLTVAKITRDHVATPDWRS